MFLQNDSYLVMKKRKGKTRAFELTKSQKGELKFVGKRVEEPQNNDGSRRG